MHRQRIYVDTSVIGGCFDVEFAEASWALIEMARRGEIILLTSALLARELVYAPQEVRGVLLGLPEGVREMAITTDEAHSLHRSYMDAKVVSADSEDDALHVAIATVHKADVIVSWNFKHLVNLERIKRFNVINLQQGFQPIDIRCPKEIIRNEDRESI
jgi:predicted nucleic acid-binding protein